MKTLLPIIVFFSGALLCGCDTEKASKETFSKAPWWASQTPEQIIDGKEFYVRGCSITQVQQGTKGNVSETIFEVPSRLMAHCEARDYGPGPLEYDGQYLILHVCHTSIGAGSCPGERYRSADLKHWEEYIGITWRNSEAYEAWRALGSDSKKADSIKKIVE